MTYPVPIIGTIDVTDPRDTYPTHSSNLGYGGIHHVATIEERDAITTDRRVAGMLCTVQQDGVTYQLASDLATWVAFVGGVKVLKIPFSISDNNLFLFQCQLGGVVSIEVMIVVPFTVGTEIGISGFFTRDLIDPQSVGSYIVGSVFCNSTRDVFLALDGDPVVGQGILLINT